jgi:hypothetical protein
MSDAERISESIAETAEVPGDQPGTHFGRDGGSREPPEEGPDQWLERGHGDEGLERYRQSE